MKRVRLYLDDPYTTSDYIEVERDEHQVRAIRVRLGEGRILVRPVAANVVVVSSQPSQRHGD